jgi:hypothetical protein
LNVSGATTSRNTRYPSRSCSSYRRLCPNFHDTLASPRLQQLLTTPRSQSTSTVSALRSSSVPPAFDLHLDLLTPTAHAPPPSHNNYPVHTFTYLPPFSAQRHNHISLLRTRERTKSHIIANIFVLATTNNRTTVISTHYRIEQLVNTGGAAET